MSLDVLKQLAEQFGRALVRTHSERGDDTAVIEPAAIRAVCLWLRDTPELAFDMLTDLTAVDYLEQGRRPRFEVVYHLYSLPRRHRVRLKVGVDDPAAEVDTVSDLWRNGNWLEREAWDLYGIKFRNHPDMRRILLYEAFEGHPLRKDYVKDRRQPLVRRPAAEIAAALGQRPEARRSLI